MDQTLVLFVAVVLLSILVLLHSVVLLGLVHLVHGLAEGRTQGALAQMATSGQEAPLFEGVDVMGGQFSSASLAGAPYGILFVSPSCPTCTLTLAEMRALLAKADGRLVVVCRGGHDECDTLAASHEVALPVILDGDERIFGLYGVTDVPTAVLVEADSRIRSRGQPVRSELESLTAPHPASG